MRFLSCAQAQARYYSYFLLIDLLLTSLVSTAAFQSVCLTQKSTVLVIRMLTLLCNRNMVAIETVSLSPLESVLSCLGNVGQRKNYCKERYF
jgi:hypothetical protein